MERAAPQNDEEAEVFYSSSEEMEQSEFEEKDHGIKNYRGKGDDRVFLGSNEAYIEDF